MGYLSQLYGPLETMSQKVGDLQTTLASAERALRPARRGARRRRSAPDARPLERARGRGRVPRRLLRLRPGPRRCWTTSRSRSRRGRGSASRARPGAGKTTLVSLLDALLRPDRRRDPARRRRPARLQAGRPAQPVRDRPAGAGAVLDQHRREHRLRPARTPRRRRSRRRRRRPTPTTSSPRCRTATTRRSASAACGSPAASASASRSPARS